MNKRSRLFVFEKVAVTDAGAKGKAVAKSPDGRVIFLKNAVPGDLVDVCVKRKKSSYYEGLATKFHEYSTKRVEAPCQHFEDCGGCKWQQMGYEHQLYYKQKEVVENLERLGHLELNEVLPILGAKEQYGYRNKMEFSFSSSRWVPQKELDLNAPIKNRNACGLHVAGMWDKVLDIEKCLLQDDISNKIRNFIKSFSEEHELSFFSPKLHTGLLRTMMLRITTKNELMLVIQFFENQAANIQKLLTAVAENFPEITSLQYVINAKANDSLYDQDIILFNGKDHIEETMEGLTFKIGPKSFYQTNSIQAYELYKVIRDFAELSGNEIVYDFYTGIGTIAQFLANNCKKVVGIETVPEAIEDAKENAKLNNITNATFFAGDLKDVFNQEFIKKNGKADIIITDPPREGMHKKVVSTILELMPSKIVYVSCNSATQARDLALMKDHYKIVKLQAVDMFPQTHHIENVVLLEKR
jgi:23S rRNA (uracil1939-C5)-methyltransferase